MRKPLRLYSRMPLRMLPLTLRHRDVCAWSPDTVNTLYLSLSPNQLGWPSDTYCSLYKPSQNHNPLFQNAFREVAAKKVGYYSSCSWPLFRIDGLPHHYDLWPFPSEWSCFSGCRKPKCYDHGWHKNCETWRRDNNSERTHDNYRNHCLWPIYRRLYLRQSWGLRNHNMRLDEGYIERNMSLY